MFLNTLRIRHAIAERTGEGIKPELSAKLFVIEYTFPEFYKDVVKYRGQDFLCKLERLAKEEADEELGKELERSETVQRYYKNEDLKSLLKNEPFFCEIDIEPYIYLSGIKPSEESFWFDKPVLEELLSDDPLKMKHAADTIKKMPDSAKHQYSDTLTPKLEDTDAKIRASAAIALGIIGDAKAVEPLIEALNNENKDVRGIAAIILGQIGDAKAFKPLIVALNDESEVVRWDVAIALGIMGDAKAVEPLLKVLKDENKDVRREAARALGKIGDAKAVETTERGIKR